MEVSILRAHLLHPSAESWQGAMSSSRRADPGPKKRDSFMVRSEFRRIPLTKSINIKKGAGLEQPHQRLAGNAEGGDCGVGTGRRHKKRLLNWPTAGPGLYCRRRRRVWRGRCPVKERRYANPGRPNRSLCCRFPGGLPPPPKPPLERHACQTQVLRGSEFIPF